MRPPLTGPEVAAALGYDPTDRTLAARASRLANGRLRPTWAEVEQIMKHVADGYNYLTADAVGTSAAMLVEVWSFLGAMTDLSAGRTGGSRKTGAERGILT